MDELLFRYDHTDCYAYVVTEELCRCSVCDKKRLHKVIASVLGLED